MTTKPKDLIYSVTEMPPIARLIPLGFQFTVYIAVGNRPGTNCTSNPYTISAAPAA